MQVDLFFFLAICWWRNWAHRLMALSRQQRLKRRHLNAVAHSCNGLVLKREPKRLAE